MNHTAKSNSIMINRIAFGFSAAFLAAAILGGIYTGELSNLPHQWYMLLISPSPLVTDYFNLGSLGSAFLNAAACGFGSWAFMYFLPGESQSSTLAGYFLVVAHAFYGLNFFNMWPCFLAAAAVFLIRKQGVRKNLNVCMFATCFGPLIGELMFRYLQQDTFVLGELHVTVHSVMLTVLVSILLGIVIPTILPAALSWHKGFNLYNGGLAFGMLGFFIFNFFFKTLGMKHYGRIVVENPLYESFGGSFNLFCNCFFLLTFLTLILCGWYRNGKSFRGYSEFLLCTGHQTDLAKQFGPDLLLINIGFVGLLFQAYLNIAFLFEGVGFTGPTVGVTVAALTFTAIGQHPGNVWPVLVGYQILFFVSWMFSRIVGIDITWSLSTQGYINGAAFATGLCPFTGRYGIGAGIAAGFICASMCTSTSAFHGGYVLYNGGLTAGLTALILLPFLEHHGFRLKDEVTYLRRFFR